MIHRYYDKHTSGFTLIELLIVIAILGVLAVVLLVAINPVQQLARARDTGRKSAVAQLGKAVEGYAIYHKGKYPTQSSGWITNLQTEGEIGGIPSEIEYLAGGNPCNPEATRQNNYCYQMSTTGGVVYTLMESTSERSLCGSSQVTIFVWSSIDGRAGTICRATNVALTPTSYQTDFKD